MQHEQEKFMTTETTKVQITQNASSVFVINATNLQFVSCNVLIQNTFRDVTVANITC